ncbi:hypothetical protein [Paraliobacillus sp. X-1268]|uniref:hypothetical protein n=1 Tax=Paraliobacillus sp. X-1268 TaxID=2213193 RepID=UPI000E3DB617|nr:hypothetical protein [Paraliobacillus sp. X-1268]
MSDFFTLKVLDRFKRLFPLFGVNYPVMRRILAIKLTMDQRRVPTIFQDMKQKENGNPLVKSLLLYGFYGLILIPFILMDDNFLFQMSIVFGIFMFILMTSMISDFSTVLLDVRDKTILHTKPINSKTISAAKLIHVIIYMSQITGSFVMIPLIVAGAVQGIGFALLFLAEIILNALFIIVVTALFYIFILRFFDGEKLKDFINYVQIFLSVTILIGYQIVARSFEFVDLNVQFDWQWWHLLLPPVWFAAPFEWFLSGNQSMYTILFSIMALVIPILSIVLYLYLVPSFERNLQKLLETSGTKRSKGLKWERFLAKLSCGSQEERTVFRFASKMLRQEREFKLKVYPSIGFSIVMPFIILFNVLRTGLDSPNAYLTIYFCNLMIPNIVHMLKFSGSYKGAWIYRTLPFLKPKAIYRATLKAFLFQLYMPVILVISCIFMGFFSFHLLPDVIAIILTGWLYALICYKLMNNQQYPFSESFSFAQNINTGSMILLISLIGIFTLMHYLVSLLPFGVYFYNIILAIINWIAWKKVFDK